MSRRHMTEALRWRHANTLEPFGALGAKASFKIVRQAFGSGTHVRSNPRSGQDEVGVATGPHSFLPKEYQMSEQDKEMESAAEKYARRIANPVLRSMLPSMSRGGFAAYLACAFAEGWKAASERTRCTEPGHLITEGRCLMCAHASKQVEFTSNQLEHLQSKLATALEALEWYANDGHTGRPILAGNVAREAIALIKGAST